MAKRFLAVFFVYIFFRPGKTILRLFFYKVIVKIYCYYLLLLKKLGWRKRRPELFSFLLSQKLVHVLVVVITISLIFINITPTTRAGGFTEKAHRTILSDLIKSEFSEFEDDQQLIIETFDKEAVVSAVQQSYLDNLSSFRPQARVKMGTGEEDLFIEEELPTIQGGTSLVKPDIASTKITKRARTETISYEVESGDSVSTIAQEFGISVSTILWENNLSSWSIIRPGNKLSILPESGIVHKVAAGESIASVAKKYKIEEEKITIANKLAKDDKLQISQKLFVPGGKKYSYPAYQPQTYTGFSAIRDIVKSPNAKPATGNKMNWPTVGSRITQYYSWRHHGLDIANKIGTPIYAADAGTVEMVGWGTGYGNQIVINHGGGKKTRYAHLSKFHVKRGEQVSKGQTIGSMGSTGWSTGSHLHFEVIIAGRKYNPLNYIR